MLVWKNTRVGRILLSASTHKQFGIKPNDPHQELAPRTQPNYLFPKNFPTTPAQPSTNSVSALLNVPEK